MDETGVIKGGMWEHQRAWWAMPNFVRLLVTGYGGGKTLTFCKRMIDLAMINAPAPVAMVSPTYTMALDTTIATTAELLEGKRSLLGKSFWWDYNQNRHLFVIKYARRTAHLKVYSGDNPLRLRGPNLAAAGIDEPFIQDAEVFKQLIARVRHPRAKRKEINLTGTPEQLNWGYDLAIGDPDFGEYDVGMVQASTAANKALGEDYVNRLLGSLSDKEAEAYVAGQFINLATGLVFHAFSPDRNVMRLRPPDGAMWGAGMDFNVNPMSAVIFWYTKDHIHVVDVIETPNSDTQDMCGHIAEHYPKVRTIFPDPAGKQRHTNAPGGKTDFYYIKQAGYDIEAPKAHDSLRDSRNAVNGALSPARGLPRLTVSPECKRLIKYLGLYSHELMNKEDQKSMSHALDALRYPVARLMPIARGMGGVRRLHGA